MNKITVVDSMMGTGKTIWSLDFVNKSSLAENFLYITPFIDEINRVIKNTPNKDFKQPLRNNNTKYENIKELLKDQEDIVSTHALFRKFDKECRELIKEGKYTLILDEVLEVVSEYKLDNKDDIKFLLKNNVISFDEDNFIIWNDEYLDYDTKYNDLKLLADNHSIMYLNDTCLIWRYPPEIFNSIYSIKYIY